MRRNLLEMRELQQSVSIRNCPQDLQSQARNVAPTFRELVASGVGQWRE